MYNFVIGIQLSSAKQPVVKQYLLLKQLCEIGPSFARELGPPSSILEQYTFCTWFPLFQTEPETMSKLVATATATATFPHHHAFK